MIIPLNLPSRKSGRGSVISLNMYLTDYATSVTTNKVHNGIHNNTFTKGHFGVCIGNSSMYAFWEMLFGKHWKYKRVNWKDTFYDYTNNNTK